MYVAAPAVAVATNVAERVTVDLPANGTVYVARATMLWGVAIHVNMLSPTGSRALDAKPGIRGTLQPMKSGFAYTG